jgi:hypothetical protein
MSWQRWLVVEVQNGFIVYDNPEPDYRNGGSTPNTSTYVAPEMKDVNRILNKLWKEENGDRE